MLRGLRCNFSPERKCFDVTVHSVPSNMLRDAGNMNLLVQCPRSIVCFANLIYANRINSRSMSRVFCDLRSQKTPRGILPVNSNALISLVYLSGRYIKYMLE